MWNAVFVMVLLASAVATLHGMRDIGQLPTKVVTFLEH